MAVPSPTLEQARCDLAALFRLLARFNLHEGIDNHCSYALDDGTILINKWGVHWSRMRGSDILQFNLVGEMLSGSGTIETTAFHIHSALHQQCPAARVIIHTHMPYTTALTCLEDPQLLPISQNALRFHGLIAYDRDYNGLVDNREEGDRLAQLLGDHNKILMLANHGVIVIGDSVGIAFNDTYFLERAAQVQVIAASTGQQFKTIAPEVITATCEQMLGLDEDKETHFRTLVKMLEEENFQS